MRNVALLGLIPISFLLHGCSKVMVKGVGGPEGPSIRLADTVVTLVKTEESYVPRLNGMDPSERRYSMGLLVAPLDGSAVRLIPLAQNVKPGDTAGAGLLGLDGNLIWFKADRVGAFDWKAGKLASSAGTRPSAKLERGISAMLCSGGLLSPTQWFGAHAPEEMETYRPGAMFMDGNGIWEAKRKRRLFLGSIDRSQPVPRILTMTPVSTIEYRNAAFVRAPGSSEPLRFSNPDGFLMLYESPYPSPVALARVDLTGSILWSAEIGITELEQVLPGEHRYVFLGKKESSLPVMATLDVSSGKVAIRSLRQESE